MMLFKTRVKALSSGWWLAILIICFSINNSQTAVIKKREAANESGNFVLDTTAAQPTILTALNNASEVVSTTKLQSVEGMNFASKETSKELTNNEILINEAKKLLEEEDKIINLNNQEEMKEKEKTEESVKNAEEQNVLMKNHTETQDNLQDIKEIIKQLETKEQNLEEATKTSTEFSSNDIKIDKIPKLKEQTLQQEEDAKDQGEIEAKSYENSLKFEHEKPQPPSRILTELRTESTTKKSKILESHGENSIENSRELNKNVLVEEFKEKSAVINNNNNESQLKVKLMPLETSTISTTQETVKEIVTSNSLDNSKNQEDSKSLESVETTTVKMFIETSTSVAEVTESWEVLEKTTLTPFIGEEKPKDQLTNTIQDGIDREVLIKAIELPQINTTNTETTTSETLKNEPDLLIFEGDKKEYARSMFKEEEEETTTSNLQENKEDFLTITTFRPAINLHKEQEVGEANVKQQTENVSVNPKGKTAKFINDNSTNAQQLNLPNNAEVWSLAAMKSLPKANVSLETAPAHNHSQEFKENLLQLHNSSLTMSSNSEKNLLDWSQIMMDKELSTTTRNEEKEMEKEREENHLDTDERIKQSITTTSKPFEETTTQLKLQVRVEKEEVTLAPETISVTTLETILSQANDKNNNETDKNHEKDKKIEENMNNHLEMLTETLDVTTTTTTANNNTALVDNHPMNATMNIEPNLNEINLTLKQKDLNNNDDSTTAAGNIKNLDMETTTAETLASTTEATAVVADITTTVEQISSETTTVSTLETSKQNASLNNDAIQKITETTITTNNNNNYNNVNLNETNSTTQTTTVTVSTALHEELENNENITAKNQYINIETTATTTVLPITTFRPNILAITSSTTTSTKAPNFEQEVDQNGNEIQTNLTTNNEPQQKQSIITTTTKVELDDNNSTKTIETHLAESREFETTTILAAKSTETENTLKSSIETTTSSSKDVNNLETTTPKLEDETTIGSSAPVATNEELERKEIETETATTTTETTSTTETNKTPVVVLETKPSENLTSTTITATTISSTEENITLATTTAKQEKEVLTSQEENANIETTTNSSNMTTTTIFSTTTTTMPVTAAKDEETYISLLDDTTTQSYSPTTISTATTTTTSPTPTPLASSTTTTTTTTTSTLPSAITTKVEEIYNVIHSTTTELIQTTTQQLLTETEEESSTSSSTTTTTYDSSSTLYFTEMIPDTTTPSTKIIETADIGKSLPTLTSIMGGNSGNMYPKNSEASGETDVNVIIAITVSVIGVIALILLVGFLYLMRKRQKQNSYPNRCRPVSMDEFTIDNASIGGSMRKSSALRSSKRTYGNLAFDDPSLRHNPMGVHELAKFAQEKLRIFEEFRDVPQITSRLDEVPPGCEDKNRYANVLPLPETRVILQRLNDDEKTEYINANYVTGPKDAPNYYIACQAPLESTVEDFWRMIWEQQSRVIIQATDLIENGVEKCAEYLPPSVTLDNHSSFGDFQITLQNREVKDKYAISTILLKNVNENASRELTHYWYKWPEVGVPAEEAPIIAMLLEARSSLISYAIEQANEDKEKSSMATLKSAEEGTVSNNGSTMSPNSNGSSANGSTGEINGNISMVPIKKTARNQGPLTIHCSPGTGRTGTIIACDIAIRSLETPKRTVDIPQIVYYVRRGRASAVLTKEQYEFIYKVTNMYAAKITNPTNYN
ncbi:Tyrosine-protein phosphatase non-receptor type 9 [Lucilia cuprina]|nr:Tyrosine-protein phosphatase non-receptor type 9 [Lucilia cuprina]KAI8129501.1 Tyrosine-protein phosphatase non-receptor type 9 [Lucilia cuprina]